MVKVVMGKGQEEASQKTVAPFTRMIRGCSGGLGVRVDTVLLGHVALPPPDWLLTTFPNALESSYCSKWPQNGLSYCHGEWILSWKGHVHIFHVFKRRTTWISFALPAVAPPTDVEDALFIYNYKKCSAALCSATRCSQCCVHWNLGRWKSYHQAANS